MRPKRSFSKERFDILLKLRRHGPQTPKELGELLDKKSGAIRKLLLTMKDDGQVVKDEDGCYHVPGGGNANGNGSNGENSAKISQMGDSVTSVTGVTGDTGDAGQRPLSFDAEPGVNELSELKRRRDEVTFDKEEEGTTDLLMAGWKQVEGGKWEQPKTGFKYDQELALKVLNDDPSVGEYFD